MVSKREDQGGQSQCFHSISLVPSMLLGQYCEELVPQREVSPRDLPEESEQALSRAQRIAWS